MAPRPRGLVLCPLPECLWLDPSAAVSTPAHSVPFHLYFYCFASSPAAGCAEELEVLAGALRLPHRSESSSSEGKAGVCREPSSRGRVPQAERRWRLVSQPGKEPGGTEVPSSPPQLQGWRRSHGNIPVPRAFPCAALVLPTLAKSGLGDEATSTIPCHS